MRERGQGGEGTGARGREAQAGERGGEWGRERECEREDEDEGKKAQARVEEKARTRSRKGTGHEAKRAQVQGEERGWAGERGGEWGRECEREGEDRGKRPQARVGIITGWAYPRVWRTGFRRGGCGFEISTRDPTRTRSAGWRVPVRV
jgi:hypothetical protein